MRVGIIGGTFDPIHHGHLLIAEEARVRLNLEEILFIPTGQPWMKAAQTLSSAHHRTNMVRLGVESNPFFRALSIETNRPGPTYTLETLEELQRDADGRDSFFFILGTDSLREFPKWKQPEKILELCTLVTAQRPGFGEVDLSPLDAILPSPPVSDVDNQEKLPDHDIPERSDQAVAGDQVVVLDGPLVATSGTDIRRRVALGLSIRYQVPENVEDYVNSYRLYRAAEVDA